MPKLDKLFDEKAKVKVVTVNDLHKANLKVDGEDLEKLLTQGYYIKDERTDEEISKVFVKTISDRELSQVSKSGFYEILTETGQFEKAAVFIDYPIVPSRNPSYRTSLTFSNPLACVVLLDYKKDGAYDSFITLRKFVYANAHYCSEAFQQLYDDLPDALDILSKTRTSAEDVYIICHKTLNNEHLISTPPFHILDRAKNKNDYHRILIELYDEYHYAESIYYEKKQTKLEQNRLGKFEIVFGRVSSSILFEVNNQRIFVPKTSKALKLNITSCSCVDSAYPGLFSDPLTLELIIKDNTKPLRVIWQSTNNKKEAFVQLNDKIRNPFDALKELIVDYGLREEDALKVLAISKNKKVAEFYILDRYLKEIYNAN